jgi:hypothetical protein
MKLLTHGPHTVNPEAIDTVEKTTDNRSEVTFRSGKKLIISMDPIRFADFVIKGLRNQI